MLEVDEELKQMAMKLGLQIPDREFRDRYIPVVFPEIIKNTRMPFDQDARRELEILVNEAPFDVGIDNIFSDKQGQLCTRIRIGFL